jgi:hypothetical protein
VRAGEQQRRVNPGAPVEGKAGELRPERRVRRADRGLRGVGQRHRRDRVAGVEQPARDAERVVAVKRAARLQQRGEPAAQLARPRRGDGPAHDLAVERVREPDRAVGRRPVEHDHAVGLRGAERRVARQLDDEVEGQRLAQRDELDRVALVLAERGQPPHAARPARRARPQRARRSPARPAA